MEEMNVLRICSGYLYGYFAKGNNVTYAPLLLQTTQY